MKGEREKCSKFIHPIINFEVIKVVTKLLRLTALLIHKPLTNVINKSLSKGCVPAD